MTDEAKGSFKSLVFDFLKFTILAVLIVVPIRIFIIQPFIVSGISMEPTFHNGDYLIVDEISYRFEQPKKDDVIVFRYPKDTSKFFIKRVEGLPGETVKSNGEEITLKDNEYFVLGDNRQASSDSRVWGTLPKNLIIGRVFLRLWPLNKAEAFPGQK